MQAFKPLAQRFYFDSFSIEPGNGQVLFNYSTDTGHSFTHTLTFDFPKNTDAATLSSAAFSLGMAELIHYWKALLAPEIVIKAGKLSEGQKAFWENLYMQGLGEFFYVNKIDFRGILRVENDPAAPALAPSAASGARGVLVPLGGGKDSLVTGERLKKIGKQFSWFELEPLGLSEDLKPVSGVTSSVAIGRDVRKNFQPILDLVGKGAPNGHVPITATYIFAAVFAAKASGYADVILSLERSANFGNVEYLGMTVNHQYSKSFEFEKAANDYIRQYIDPSVRMFSLVRPLYEIQILKEFASYPQYFNYFISCNRGLKKGAWCGECAKCAFMFAGLSAFLPLETVTGIFKKNLFEDESLIPLYKDMAGFGEMKPFDCVGTFEENLLALYLSGEKIRAAGGTLPAVLAALPIEEGKKHLELLNAATLEHLIPQDYLKPKIAIAGFGMEGRAVYDYFKGRAELSVFDEKDVDMAGVDAVFHKGFEIPADITTVYKSPGIPTSKISLGSPSTTISTFAALLLSEVGARTIGVTGTKGKSTTAALIHHILHSAGKDAVLLGNIGVADSSLIRHDLPERIYVMELSSYQLEHAAASPHVAVITSFYPEHLDHHGSFERYRDAKLNIARFQNGTDVLINASALSDRFAGKVITPRLTAPFATKLLGEHNQMNCALAAAAAGLYGVSEEEARKHIATFEPLPFRLEKVAEAKGITFYDDSLATIPEATLASISALSKVDTIIVGGEDRGISFEPFADALSRTGIRTFVIFPETGQRMVQKVGNRKVITASSMKEAVAAAYDYTPEGGVVLLSNASPSFNMFKDYKDKSAQYRQWVKTLGV